MEFVINIIVFILVGFFLVYNPFPIMKFVGTIFWHMGKFTTLGKSEETKEFFLGENPFWFRALGIILLIVAFISLIIKINENISY